MMMPPLMPQQFRWGRMVREKASANIVVVVVVVVVVAIHPDEDGACGRNVIAAAAIHTQRRARLAKEMEREEEDATNILLL